MEKYNRGPLKKFVFDKDGCKSEGEPKTYCEHCIFNNDCPKEKINEDTEE